MHTITNPPCTQYTLKPHTTLTRSSFDFPRLFTQRISFVGRGDAVAATALSGRRASARPCAVALSLVRVVFDTREGRCKRRRHQPLNLGPAAQRPTNQVPLTLRFRAPPSADWFCGDWE
ncbi:hypothetical protein LSAT2_014786, partial [Lamellibrachia satsuma]